MPRTHDAVDLVRAHQASVWRYLRLLGCDPAQADDLTQETFLAVLRRPFADQGPVAAAAYLRQVARNLFLKALRRPGARPREVDLDQAEEALAGFEGQDGGDEYLDALGQCLTTLSGRVRRVLDLRYRDGLSRTELAAAMGLSADGIKSLMARARAALKQCIEQRIGR
jgi:RNA polymerase sigma-70 factor (ECF subfamily)